MTRLDVIKANKRAYTNVEKAIESMTGLEKAVAENMTLAWCKGQKWMGGLSDRQAEKAYDKLMAMGYELTEIMDEFDRQMTRFS